MKNDSLKTLKERVQNNEKPLLLNSIMKTLNLIDLSDSPKDDNVKIISGKVRDRWYIGNDLVCFFTLID